MNLFIRKRDPEYFRAVVVPLIQCKMEKQFIDYYLLEDYAHVAQYFEKVDQLNAMEQCLLVDSLIQVGEEEKATMLAKRLDELMEKERSADPNGTVQRENKIFDLVLNLNNLSNVKSGLDKIKQNAERKEEMER